jgi:hypothetical protein
MQILDEIASRYPDDRIVMVLDGAGWHQSGSLVVPENIRLLSLPPYFPEFNPVKNIWAEFREKSFDNRVLDRLTALEVLTTATFPNRRMQSGLESRETRPY